MKMSTCSHRGAKHSPSPSALRDFWETHLALLGHRGLRTGAGRRNLVDDHDAENGT